MPAPGQIMSVSTQVILKPTPEQRKQLADLQKEVDAGLDKLLTDDQKKQLKQMRADFPRGGLRADPAGRAGQAADRPVAPGAVLREAAACFGRIDTARIIRAWPART